MLCLVPVHWKVLILCLWGSAGCLVGQVQMAAPARRMQLSEMPVRRAPGIPEQVLHFSFPGTLAGFVRV